MNKQKKTNHRRQFYRHLGKNLSLALILTAGALIIGMAGYHFLENMTWIDAFLNAAMILSGMGPANNLTSFAGKLFAGFYALFSGLAFIATFIIILSPALHYFFRKVHLDDVENDD